MERKRIGQKWQEMSYRIRNSIFDNSLMEMFIFPFFSIFLQNYHILHFDLRLFQIENFTNSCSNKIMAQSMFRLGWGRLRLARAKSKLKKAIINIWWGEPVTTMIGHIVPLSLTLALRGWDPHLMYHDWSSQSVEFNFWEIPNDTIYSGNE